MKYPYHFIIDFHEKNVIIVAPEKKRKELIALLLSLLLLFTTSVWAMAGISSHTAAQRELRLDPHYDVELHDLHGTTEQIITASALESGAMSPAPININVKMNQKIEKHLWMQNPPESEGAIFVRMQVTEIIRDHSQEEEEKKLVESAIFRSTDAADTLEPLTIQWELGSPIIDIADWNGTSTGDYWLMDTDTGYAYWMKPLYPGAQTGEFLSSITGRQYIGPDYTYSIQVLADAISATEAADRSQWAASANNGKLDQLFTLYQGLADPSRVVFRDINGTTSVDVADFKAAFPATAMQTFVQDVVDSNGDSLVTQQELNGVTKIANNTDTAAGVVQNITSPVTSLNGIEQFPYLQDIDIVNDSSLSGRIDLTRNPKLTRVNISNCAITKVDASRNQVVGKLFLNDNQITDIKLPAGTNVLDILWLHSNQLESLDLTNQTSLYSFTMRDNRITSLDISSTRIGLGLANFGGDSIKNNGMTSLTVNRTQNTNTTLMTELQNSTGNALGASGAITVRE